MLSDVAETRVEASVVKLDAKAELVGVVPGVLSALSFAYLIALSLCSFVQSPAFRNAVAPCGKVSAVIVIAKNLS
jgi:hypothetical protein